MNVKVSTNRKSDVCLWQQCNINIVSGFFFMHISNEGRYPTESGALIRTKGSPEKKKQRKKSECVFLFVHASKFICKTIRTVKCTLNENSSHAQCRKKEPKE